MEEEVKHKISSERGTKGDSKRQIQCKTEIVICKTTGCTTTDPVWHCPASLPVA